MSHWKPFAIFFSALFFACAASAADLKANRTEIVIGENVAVKARGVSYMSDIEWQHSPEVIKLDAERDKARFRGAAPGEARITLLVDGKPEGSVTVRVIDHSGVAQTTAPGAINVQPVAPIETPYPPYTGAQPLPQPTQALPTTAPYPAMPYPVAQPATGWQGGAPALPGAAQPALPVGGRDYSSPHQYGGQPGAWTPPAPVVKPATPSPTFTLYQPGMLTLIQNYHWNEGQGAYPGHIAVVDAQGRQYGPWQATGSPGPGGIPNVYWEARPMISLPAGTYSVIDSDPTTWTPDTQSGGRGFSRHEVQAVAVQPVGGVQYPGQAGGMGGWSQPGTATGAAGAYGLPGGYGLGQAAGTGYPGGGAALPGYGTGGWAQPGTPATAPTYPGYTTGAGGWAQPGVQGGMAGLPGVFGQTGNKQLGSGAWATSGQVQGQVPSQPRSLLEIGNSQPVGGKPEKSSKLDLDNPHVITLIRTYHWNGGQGAYPGSIGLRCRDGSSFGPWQAVGETGPDGTPNAYWTVRPNIQLPPCVCVIVVSDPASWSHNDGSKNRGFAHVEGYPLAASAAGQAGMPGSPNTDTALETLERAHNAVRKMDETKKALDSLRSIFK